MTLQTPSASEWYNVQYPSPNSWMTSQTPPTPEWRHTPPPEWRHRRYQLPYGVTDTASLWMTSQTPPTHKWRHRHYQLLNYVTLTLPVSEWRYILLLQLPIYHPSCLVLTFTLVRYFTQRWLSLNDNPIPTHTIQSYSNVRKPYHTIRPALKYAPYLWTNCTYILRWLHDHNCTIQPRGLLIKLSLPFMWP